MHQLEALSVRAADVRKATRSDRVLQLVWGYMQEGWPDSISDELKPYGSRQQEITMQDDCLLWGIRVIVPSILRKALLRESHADHPGIVRMKSVARGYMWWPGMDGEIEAMAKSCEACHQAKQAPPKALLTPWSWPSKPWQRVHLDFAGPFLGKYFLLAVNAHSKWGEVWEMNSTTSSRTIQVLRQLFAAYGLPQQLVTDNSPHFTSDVFVKRNGIKYSHCTPYHPASNGEAERFVRAFKEAMKASCHDSLPLAHRLQSFL